MNNTLHTPGPWYIAHHTEMDGMKSIDIRHCCDIPHSTPQIHQVARLPENTMANARLISAAPDLLQIARDYVLLCRLHGMEGAVLDSALSAIAKAEGREA